MQIAGRKILNKRSSWVKQSPGCCKVPSTVPIIIIVIGRTDHIHQEYYRIL